jgi:hypothetical protein
MKIQVPIDEADFVRPEVREKVKSLLSEHQAIIHTASAVDKIQRMQYMVEAVALLKDPVESMIKAGKKIKIDHKKKLKELVKLHVGNRYKSRVLDAYASEEQDLWGLYNAMTYVASHDRELKSTGRETLLEKAAVMLRTEVLRK